MCVEDNGHVQVHEACIYINLVPSMHACMYACMNVSFGRTDDDSRWSSSEWSILAKHICGPCFLKHFVCICVWACLLVDNAMTRSCVSAILMV